MRRTLPPGPAPRHVNAASALGGQLFNPFQLGRGGPGEWWILDEPELHLGDDVLVPDLAGWRRERMPALPETAWFDLAPDWACEMLLPSTRRLDLFAKRPLYAAHGVRHLWIVDPDTRGAGGVRVAERRMGADRGGTGRCGGVGRAVRGGGVFVGGAVG